MLLYLEQASEMLAYMPLQSFKRNSSHLLSLFVIDRELQWLWKSEPASELFPELLELKQQLSVKIIKILFLSFFKKLCIIKSSSLVEVKAVIIASVNDILEMSS